LVTGERPVKFVWASIVARSETTRSNRRPGQPKAATTNRVRDYQALERENLTGAMSLRELCRAHGITAHSAVMVQARQGGWAEKRETYRARASAKYIEHRADHAALREAEVRDHAIDAIDEAITKFRSDLRATKKVVMVIDRLQVLFGRPSTISEGRGFAATVTTEALPLDAL
jgi:hypothetical protein